MPQLFGFVTLSWKFVHIVQHLKRLVRKLWISVVWGKKNTTLLYLTQKSFHNTYLVPMQLILKPCMYTAPTTLNSHRKRTLCFCCLSHKQNCFILSWAFFTALWRTVIFYITNALVANRQSFVPAFYGKTVNVLS